MTNKIKGLDLIINNIINIDYSYNIFKIFKDVDINELSLIIKHYLKIIKNNCTINELKKISNNNITHNDKSISVEEIMSFFEYREYAKDINEEMYFLDMEEEASYIAYELSLNAIKGNDISIDYNIIKNKEIKHNLDDNSFRIILMYTAIELSAITNLITKK